MEKDIKDSENYTREIENVKMRTVQVPEGSHTTTCLYCNTTCHKICYIKGDNEKYNCSAMYNGFCQVCNNKCKWDQHKNTPYYYESYIVKEIITLKELQKKYNDSSSKANEKKNLLNNIKTQIKNLNKECIETQEEITNTINILRKIALNKEILSAEEHIDILISNEKMEKKPGFIDRIESLEKLKKQKKLMKDAYNKDIKDMAKIDEFLNKDYQEMEKKHNCIIF